MRSKRANSKAPAERVVKDIRRKTRRQFSAEEKIRIVLEGLRGDDSIAELCRKEGIAQSLYYSNRPANPAYRLKSLPVTLFLQRNTTASVRRSG